MQTVVINTTHNPPYFMYHEVVVIFIPFLSLTFIKEKSLNLNVIPYNLQILKDKPKRS